MNWSLISAVNNQRLLETCLLKSDEVKSASEVILKSGFSSAGAAYNQALSEAKGEILVLAHQDVYFPPGWVARVERAVSILDRQQPNWGVLGVWGVNRSGLAAGHVYCGGTMRQLGKPFDEPVEVRSLDEVVLIIRKSSGLRFDERLPGFHLYGTDICLQASRSGKKCYVISAFCIHNTNGYRLLPLSFWKNYLLLRRKWFSELPIETSCISITRSGVPVVMWNLGQMKSLMLKDARVGKRVAQPDKLFQELLSQGQILPQAEIRSSL